MRASELLGRTVYAPDGTAIGVISDLLCAAGEDGLPRVRSAIVAPRHHTRLLGYDRPGIQGPWLIEKLAGWLQRGVREIPWPEVRLDP